MRFDVRTLARPVADIDFAALTDAVRTGDAEWVDDGVLEIPFDRELTPAEVDAVMMRLTSPTDDEASWRQSCEAYLDLAAPTTTQNAAQLKTLTRLALAAFERQR